MSEGAGFAKYEPQANPRIFRAVQKLGFRRQECPILKRTDWALHTIHQHTDTSVMYTSVPGGLSLQALVVSVIL